MGAKSNYSRGRVGALLEPSKVQVGPKLVSESMLEGFRGALGGAQTSKIDFNSLVAANMGPSWRQAGANLAPASDQ